jgi:hypothetical protein
MTVYKNYIAGKRRRSFLSKTIPNISNDPACLCHRQIAFKFSVREKGKTPAQSARANCIKRKTL